MKLVRPIILAGLLLVLLAPSVAAASWLRSFREVEADGCTWYVAAWSDGTFTKLPVQCPPGATPANSQPQLLTVNGLKTTQSVTYHTADAGKTYVIADLTISNTTNDPLHVNPLYVRAKDVDGFQYQEDSATYADDQAIKIGDIPPGQMTRGIIIFQMPAAAAMKTINIFWQT